MTLPQPRAQDVSRVLWWTGHLCTASSNDVFTNYACPAVGATSVGSFRSLCAFRSISSRDCHTENQKPPSSPIGPFTFPTLGLLLASAFPRSLSLKSSGDFVFYCQPTPSLCEGLYFSKDSLWKTLGWKLLSFSLLNLLFHFLHVWVISVENLALSIVLC